jgi:acetate kinase
MKVLVLNSGSSSLKACLYEIGENLPMHPPPCLWEGRIEWGGDTATVSVKNVRGAVWKEQRKVSSREEFVSQLLATMRIGTTSILGSISEIDVVGHRVVHGGPSFEDPVLITPEVHSAIAEVGTLAPLHVGAELEGMKIVEGLLGAVPQIAVFDTGFHRQMPLSSIVYPGPYEWFERGIHRYGFHGINHQSCAVRAAQLLERDVNSHRRCHSPPSTGCAHSLRSYVLVDPGKEGLL